MAIYQVDKCCCCLKLTTGAYIVAILGIIDAIITFITTASVLFQYDKVVEWNKENNPELAKTMMENKTTFIVIQLAFLVMCVAFLVVCVLLIRGTLKRKSKLIIPSLIWLGVGNVLLLFMFISYLFLESVSFGYILALLLLLGLNIYIWICIYSLYKSLKSLSLPTA